MCQVLFSPIHARVLIGFEDNVLSFMSAYALARFVHGTLALDVAQQRRLSPHLKIPHLCRSCLSQDVEEVLVDETIPDLWEYRGDRKDLILSCHVKEDQESKLRDRIEMQGLESELLDLFRSLVGSQAAPLLPRKRHRAVGIEYVLPELGPKGVPSYRVYSEKMWKKTDGNSERIEASEAIPPLQYFLDVLHHLRWIEPKQPLELFVFTNHREPKRLHQQISTGLGFPCHIQVMAQTEPHNSWDAMGTILYKSAMECMLRPHASYTSDCAKILNPLQEWIMPHTYGWLGRDLMVTTAVRNRFGVSESLCLRNCRGKYQGKTRA